MLSCSKMEHDDMTSENGRDQQTADQRKQRRVPRSPAPRLPQSGPPLVNDGLEAPRSGDC
jgi:hypothetical protein